MLESLLRLARRALRADGASLILPDATPVGDNSPWPPSEILEALQSGSFNTRGRLLHPVLNGALVVWTEPPRDWTAWDLELAADFAQELEPRFTREGMLAAVVDGSDAAIFVKDERGRYLEVNPATAEAIGRPRKEILGCTDSELFPLETARRLRRIDERVFSQGVTVQVEETIPAGEAEATYLSLKFPLILAGQRVGTCGISTDVTNRVNLARNLARTRERLNLALEGGGLGLWMCDLPFDRLEWSERCKHHFGLPPNAEVTIDLFYQLIHPDDRESVRLALEQSIKNAELYDVVYRTQGPDGVSRWIRALGRCSYDENGEPNRIDGLTMNVTETFEADRALRLSERRYRSLVSATASIVWVAEADGSFVRPQEDWESYTGQQPDEYRDFGWLKVVHPEDVDELLADFLQATQTRSVFKNSGRLWHAASQDYRYFEVRGVPVTVGGEVLEWVGLVVDVHERLAAERTALESHLRFRAALNQSVGFIAVLSPEGELLEINDTPLQISGVEREEAIGKIFWETPWWEGRPSAQERLREDFQAALVGGPVRTQALYYTADGSERVADRCLTACRGPDGQVALVLAEGMDVTERVRAERGIRLLAKAGKALSTTLLEDEMLARFSQVLTDQFSELCVVDRLFSKEQRMDRFSAVAGDDPEELMATLLAEPPTLGSDHLAVQVMEKGQGVLRSCLDEEWLVEQGLTAERATKVCKAGINSLISVPIKGREGVLGTLSLGLFHPGERRFQDDDYRLAGELALRLGVALENARLYFEVSQSEQRFRSLSEELVEARDEALRANKMKSQFLANMSHEIRTPMVGVQGMLELLSGTSLTREQQEFVDTVRDCSQSLLTVLDDVLDLARIDAGKMVIQNRPFHLATAIKGTLSLFELQAQQRRLDLRVKISDELPDKLQGDPDRLRQLLVNLVSNAMKFTEDGFVELRVYPKSDSLRVEVQDSGIGIEPGKLDRLWTAFEQVDNSSTRRYEGTGLGLSIVKRLVDLMNGLVGADSEPGKGSVFWFEIPLVEAESFEVTGKPKRELEKIRPGGRLLVAEDNPINRRVLVQQLQGLGYQVTEAHNGLEAIERIKETEIDLVLMDCQMPELDGYSATRRIRELGYQIPILALTAHAMSGERTRCLAAGMDDHLTKPLGRDALAAALERWM